MVYDLTHSTIYEYTGPVAVSHHLLRLHPRAMPTQDTLEYELRIDPLPSVTHSHLDYFGNSVTFATIETAHKQLTILSRSRISIGASAPPERDETPRWESVRDSCRGEQIGSALEASEFIFDSPLIETSEAFRDYANESFSAGAPILEAVLHLTNRIYHDFQFDPTATTVATPLTEVFRNRRGVCQDFAHLEIACLRALGLPARYVSGYLETQPPPGKPRLLGADASHAWMAFYSPGIGWTNVDPTNNTLPGMRHITLGWGRDYGDVCPVRGVILGTGEHQLKVAVDMAPIIGERDSADG